MIDLSILDYSPIDENTTSQDALHATTKLANLADNLGFRRFWVSEHHGMQTLAGSNPEMLMMHLAANTQSIRIGSGGVMLQHYSAYKVAEGIKLIEALYPSRIDLGVGRAPGGDKFASAALNFGKSIIVPYEQQLHDLKEYFSDLSSLAVMPKISTKPALWSLGTSEYSGTFAAKEGMSFVFAHFINPRGDGVAAIKNYEQNFVPSEIHQSPKTIVAVFVAVAATEEEAEKLAKSFDHWLLMIESGKETPFYLSPEAIADYTYTEQEKLTIRYNRNRIIVGDALSVKRQIEILAGFYNTNEIMLMPNIFGAKNRIKTVKLLAEVFNMNNLVEEKS
jgi:luciferase family oxidoreductase group 1